MSARFEIPDWMVPADPPPPPVDDLKVEALVNRFIAAKQQALFDAPDAYYRTTGADAVTGAAGIGERLGTVCGAVLDEADDDTMRAALGPRLDLHIADASDGIGRHAAAQRQAMHRQIVAERQTLIRRAAELEPDHDDKLDGLADASASAALELARLDGRPEAPAAEAARSAVWRAAIDRSLAGDDGARALTLFDRVKDRLAPADRLSLDAPLQVARLDHAADQWIARQSAADGPPLQDRVDADPELPPEAGPVVQAKVYARDSAEQSARVAAVQELDDQMRDAVRTQATRPAAYKTGTFARLADAYAAAGEPDRAAFARRMAAQDAFILPFAQASAENQQRMIDGLREGELRDSAIALQGYQADVFARDPFAAGTSIYAAVGKPVPIDDIAGRVRQARRIAHLRGVPSVVPFTADEIDRMQRVLARGSEAEKQAVRTHLEAVPEDMRPAIETSSAQSIADGRSRDTDRAFRIAPAPAFSSEEDADGPVSPGGQSGSVAVEPALGSPEFLAAEAQANELDRPSWEDLSIGQQLGVAFKRWNEEGKKRGAVLRAESAARRLEKVAELETAEAKGKELGVVEKRFLLRNRNAATELAAAVGELIEAQGNIDDLPASDAARQFLEAPTLKDAARVLLRNPGRIARAMSVEGAPSMIADLITVTALGPLLGSALLAATSGIDGYATGLVGALSLEGVDISDADTLARALQDKALMDRARRNASTDAAIAAGTSVLAMALGPGGKSVPKRAKARPNDKKAPAEDSTKGASRPHQAADLTKGTKPRAARKPPTEERQRRRDLLEENMALGKGHEDKMARAFARDPDLIFRRHITVEPPGGPPTVMDFITYRRSTREYDYHEGKGSETARLSPNQRLAHPKIKAKGSVIKGKGKPPIGGGLKLPAKKVNIVRPKDVD